MHAGLALLRLAPRDFWTMTPRELQAATGGFATARIYPGRTGLDALMARFPD